MRVVIRREVHADVPAKVLWDYVIDWPRQGDWIPRTRVERVDAADGLGGRIRAWSGIGWLGFWDYMTITTWHVDADGGGHCEVLHTGAVVRGEGVFEVVPRSATTSTFVWTELLVLPLGRLGGLGWYVVGPVMTRLVDRALGTLVRRAETAADG